MEVEESITKPFNDIEKSSAEYVAGYVANRFSNKYPELISTHVSKDSNN